VVLGWLGALLAVLVSLFLIVLFRRGGTDSGSELNRMASYGFPLVARKFPVLSEFTALALLSILVTRICFGFGYPAGLTAAFYAVLAYAYLLLPAESAVEQPNPKNAAPSPPGTERRRSSNRIATLVGLAIALLFPIPPYRQPLLYLLLAYAQVSWMTAWELIGTFFKITTVVAILFIVIKGERRPLESIGWRTPRLKDVVLGVVAFLAMQEVAMLAWPFALKAMPGAVLETHFGVALYRSLPLAVNLLGAIANATAEEVGYRGYALERLSEITGSTLLGAGIPYVVEVLCHAPIWGFHGMLLKAPPLFILVLLYLWQRSLPACIVAHLLSDLILW